MANEHNSQDENFGWFAPFESQLFENAKLEARIFSLRNEQHELLEALTDPDLGLSKSAVFTSDFGKAYDNAAEIVLRHLDAFKNDADAAEMASWLRSHEEDLRGLLPVSTVESVLTCLSQVFVSSKQRAALQRVEQAVLAQSSPTMTNVLVTGIPPARKRKTITTVPDSVSTVISTAAAASTTIITTSTSVSTPDARLTTPSPTSETPLAKRLRNEPFPSASVAAISTGLLPSVVSSFSVSPHQPNMLIVPRQRSSSQFLPSSITYGAVETDSSARETSPQSEAALLDQILVEDLVSSVQSETVAAEPPTHHHVPPSS